LRLRGTNWRFRTQNFKTFLAFLRVLRVFAVQIFFLLSFFSLRPSRLCGANLLSFFFLSFLCVLCAFAVQILFLLSPTARSARSTM
jgi:hypothetical protein